MRKGFTLIELLVVVLIIGILAAVALPQYTKAVEKSRSAEAMTLMGDILTAERIYQMATGYFTGDLGKLDIEMPSVTSNVVKTKNFWIQTTTPAVGADAVASGGLVVKAERVGGTTPAVLTSGTQAYTLYMTLSDKGDIGRYCQDTGSGNICATLAGSGFESVTAAPAAPAANSGD